MEGQAFEPRPAAAEVAFCPYDRDLQLDNPRFSGTGSASAVDQCDGVSVGKNEDLAPRGTVQEPLLNETLSRSPPGRSLQLSNINRVEVLAHTFTSALESKGGGDKRRQIAGSPPPTAFHVHGKVV
jgi:hypothetical protein